MLKFRSFLLFPDCLSFIRPKNPAKSMSAVEQYERKLHLPTGKGRRIVKIPRPLFLLCRYASLRSARYILATLEFDITSLTVGFDMIFACVSLCEAHIESLRSKHHIEREVHIDRRRRISMRCVLWYTTRNPRPLILYLFLSLHVAGGRPW